MKIMDGDMTGLEDLDGRISHEAVIRFLNGNMFKKRLDQMVANSQDYEQGLKVVFLAGSGKCAIVDMDDVSPESVGGGHIEPEDMSLFEVHTHPIQRGNSLHTVPSDEDLKPSFRNEGPFAKAVVVMGSNFQAWVWETPKTISSVKIAVRWRQGLVRINDPSYSDLDDLFAQLGDGGLKIGRGELERDRLAGSLVDLIESTGIRFG
ncbi:MAG: hypothetical protein UU93_C0003G0049 [Candidatus Amesbacteria bacterium GW2011_GWA2_42_12]|uniref:Uncharacterized protein n=1 Tax=Candidatus Amesbacteria bacterium GW2011_GWA2_42_12 TaxID=1618356 RepID=A0A0G1AFZ1_9BACT|nr:MAG: hypothetical protein UU93_C0003G0049 [Candidatus Amesbacteria bacterium GW2011_GWA2_42_12]